MSLKDTFTIDEKNPTPVTLVVDDGWYAIKTTADRVLISNDSAAIVPYSVTFPDGDEGTTSVYNIKVAGEYLLDLSDKLHGPYPWTFHLRAQEANAVVTITPAVRP